MNRTAAAIGAAAGAGAVAAVLAAVTFISRATAPAEPSLPVDLATPGPGSLTR